MKKVLIVIPTLEQGGGQKFVMDLAKGIDANKFKVTVLVYYKYSNSIFDRFAKENNIDTIYLDKSVGFHPMFAIKVRTIVKAISPDIIHTNLDSMLYLFLAYKKKQVKLHTVHTLAEKETRGLQGIVRFVAYKLLGVVPVGISDTVADSIAREHNIKRDTIPVVYNGVDCKRYCIPKSKSKDIRLVTVGNIYYVKNYSFLVDCFYEVCKEVENIRLTIVGDGVLRRNLEEQISDLDLLERVTITGVVSDVENYLANADIYVASSIFEGLPISILEAMSAGLPIISTDVGGVGDIVKKDENGILVSLGDRDKYVSAIKKMVSNAEMRHNYSIKSVLLSKKYDEKICIKGYEELYEREYVDKKTCL